ncbi:ATP-binding protein [Candidatus Magnetominusculus dajiuhuensis]|uniref:ATP-binding protein n=1 Tax=Candidatus Magnetominusculus dajiuhuensis TaxID=3137712 RepID=UPI003B4344AA
MNNSGRANRRFKLWTVFLSIIVMATGAVGLWLIAEWTKDKTIEGIQRQVRQNLELYNVYLTDKIAQFSEYPLILAENSLIVNFCGNPTNARAVNRYLSQFNITVGASVSFILNKNGTVIASSNWDSKDSAIGKRSAAFRPYFQKAINGVPAGYVAIGLTSKEPGYFASYPIRKGGEVIGVAVVKNRLDSLKLGTQEVMGTLLIADENDVIFASNDDLFNFYAIRELPEGVLSEIKADKQYEGVDLQPLPVKSDVMRGGVRIITLKPSAVTEQREVRYVMEMVYAQENGWNVYLLSEVGDLDKKIIVNIAIASSIIAVILVASLLLINIRLRKMKETSTKNQVELEHKVDERTQELHDTNEKLLFELIERKRLENALKIKTDELQHINENLRELVKKEVAENNKQEQLLIQQSRMAAMGEMIGVIAHQWRQPINAIGLIIQDLVDAFEHGEMNKEYLETEVQSTMQHIGFMSQTIDDFRNFLKPSKKKLRFNVKEAIEEIMSMFEGTLKRDSVAVSLAHSEETYLKTGYPNEFKQVILNIINNARDAIVSCRKKGLMDKGTQGQITIRLEKAAASPTQDADDKVIVYISDNGGGIPEDIIDKVFDSYFTTKTEDKGTGIGLYMSRTIIENNMGGRLTVRNTPIGAEFTIEI